MSHFIIASILAVVTSVINVFILLVYLRVGFTWAGYMQIGTAIVLLWPISALWTKRLHDRGRSGKQLLFIFIPIVGQIFFIWLAIQICFLPGKQEANHFGPAPVPMAFSPASKLLRIGIVIVLTLANMLWPLLKVETKSDSHTLFVPTPLDAPNSILVKPLENTPEELESFPMTVKDMPEEVLDEQVKIIPLENKIIVNPESLKNLEDLFKSNKSE